ncbi:uncharacterized protein TNCV_3597971 [Trichonephila clavipes]|nr:uncharacterized protein TNCV_3597971 [Trichonephila clavipes]
MLPSTKEKVSKLCPIALRYIHHIISCIEDCTGMDIKQLLSNASSSEKRRFINSMAGFILDLCDEDSNFHKANMASADCVWGVIDEKPNPQCKLPREKRLAEFLNAKSISPDDMGKNQRAGTRFLKEPASIALVTSVLRDLSGSLARRTVLRNIRKSKPWIQHKCSSKNVLKEDVLDYLNLDYEDKHWTATAGSDVVQSGRPIFDDFFQHLLPYLGNNTANVVFQMVKRLCLIRIDQ